MTKNNQILASLCYFSILMLGILFPIIVYFAVDDQEVKAHAKRALFSHLLPFILTVITVLILAAFVLTNTASTALPVIGLMAFVWIGIISFIVLIWNIIQGVLVLKD